MLLSSSFLFILGYTEIYFSNSSSNLLQSNLLSMMVCWYLDLYRMYTECYTIQHLALVLFIDFLVLKLYFHVLIHESKTYKSMPALPIRSGIATDCSTIIHATVSSIVNGIFIKIFFISIHNDASV